MILGNIKDFWEFPPVDKHSVSPLTPQIIAVFPTKQFIPPHLNLLSGACWTIYRSVCGSICGTFITVWEYFWEHLQDHLRELRWYGYHMFTWRLVGYNVAVVISIVFCVWVSYGINDLPMLSGEYNIIISSQTLILLVFQLFLLRPRKLKKTKKEIVKISKSADFCKLPIIVLLSPGTLWQKVVFIWNYAES